MNFLKEFIKNYQINYDFNDKCIVCNQNISTLHDYLCCNFYDDIRYDFYSSELRLHFLKNKIIHLYVYKFYFILNNERITLQYEKEFNNIFELKDYCINIYNKYEQNLIFL
jgi:hypothetical protein